MSTNSTIEFWIVGDPDRDLFILLNKVHRYGTKAAAIAGAHVDNHNKNASKQHGIENAKPLKMGELLNDFDRNKAGYDANWRGEYVTHAGTIESVSSGGIGLKTDVRGLTSVTLSCETDYGDSDQLVKLNPGQWVYLRGQMFVTSG